MHLFEADSSKLSFASKQEFKDKSIKNGLQSTLTLNFMCIVYGTFLFRHFRSCLAATRFLHNFFLSQPCAKASPQLTCHLLLNTRKGFPVRNHPLKLQEQYQPYTDIFGNMSNYLFLYTKATAFLSSGFSGSWIHRRS